MSPLVIVGALVVAGLALKRGGKLPGYGQPGFVAAPTPDLPVKVTGASYAKIKLGGRDIFVDANTGQEISPSEAARRMAAEGFADMAKAVAPVSAALTSLPALKTAQTQLGNAPATNAKLALATLATGGIVGKPVINTAPPKTPVKVAVAIAAPPKPASVAIGASPLGPLKPTSTMSPPILAPRTSIL